MPANFERTKKQKTIEDFITNLQSETENLLPLDKEFK